MKINLCRAGGMLAAIFLATALAVAGEDGRSVFVLTSTNNASANEVVVFKLNTGGTPSLSWENTLPTGGKGGASTNAGILQFKGDLGAVANYGSNTVSQLVRDDDFISVGPTINLAPGCMKPDSVALTEDHLFVVGTNCAESHAWPSGNVDGTVRLTDPSAAQIAVGKTWAAVTLTAGSLLQLPLTRHGALSGTYTSVTLQSDADSVPLGEAFWGDILGFTPAHSEENFAIVNNGVEYPIPGTPFSRAKPPAGWLKGRGTYGIRAILPGMLSPYSSATAKAGRSTNRYPCQVRRRTSRCPRWQVARRHLHSDSEGYVAVYSIDAYGDLSPGNVKLPRLPPLAGWRSANSSFIHFRFTRRAWLAGFFV